MTDDAKTTVPLPKPEDYLAAEITGRSGDYVLSQDPDLGGKFISRLYAIKVANKTGEAVHVRLECLDNKGVSLGKTCAVVPDGTLEPCNGLDTHFGAWIATPNGARELIVHVVKYEGSQDAEDWSKAQALRTKIRVVGDTVLLQENGNVWPKSRQGTHVYYDDDVMLVESDVVASGEDDGVRYGWVSSDGEKWVASIPHVFNPKDGLSSRAGLTLDPARYSCLSEPITHVRFTKEASEAEPMSPVLEVFDVGGNVVRIFEKDGEIRSAPYVVTPGSDGKVEVVNELAVTPEGDLPDDGADPHVIEIWPMGYKTTQASGTPLTIPAKVAGDDPSRATLTYASEGSTENDEYPNKGKGAEPGSLDFRRQSALNWVSGDDPKVVIKQDDCGT